MTVMRVVFVLYMSMQRESEGDGNAGVEDGGGVAWCELL